MPSGYTSLVADGKVTNAADFIAVCIRAFGPFVMERDDALRVTAVSDDYFDKNDNEELKDIRASLKGHQKRRAQIEGYSENELAQYAQAEFDADQKYYDKTLKEATALKLRYSVILDELVKWDADPVLQPVKDFAVEQLTMSIKHDCGMDYHRPPRLKTGAEWKASQLKSVDWNIKYDEKRLAERTETFAQRKDWIKKVNAAIKDLKKNVR